MRSEAAIERARYGGTSQRTALSGIPLSKIPSLQCCVAASGEFFYGLVSPTCSAQLGRLIALSRRQWGAGINWHMRYFRREWDESRGDDYDAWSLSEWFFE